MIKIIKELKRVEDEKFKIVIVWTNETGFSPNDINNNFKEIIYQFIEIDNLKPVIFVMNHDSIIINNLKVMLEEYKTNHLKNVTIDNLNINLLNIVKKYINCPIRITKFKEENTNYGMMGGFMKMEEMVIQFGIDVGILDINKISDDEYEERLTRHLM